MFEQFLQSKDTQNHIKWSLTLPHDDQFSPYKSIPVDQFDLYKFAKAYEELEPIISDHEYDMLIEMQQRHKAMYPEVWEEVSLTCFRDGSWEYTGLFIEGHDSDDEEWLL